MTEAGLATRRADFEALYQGYAEVVRRTAWNLGGFEDLDDIVQEVFVCIWRGWDQFEGRSDRRTWVYRITINTAREHWRRKGRRRSLLARFFGESPQPQSIPGGQGAWEQRRHLGRALDQLSREQREAVSLVYLEGLELVEAAKACGVPLGTIKSRLFAARGRLQQLLEDVHG